MLCGLDELLLCSHLRGASSVETRDLVKCGAEREEVMECVRSACLRIKHSQMGAVDM